MGVKKALNIGLNILLWAIVAVSALVTVLVFTSQNNNGVPNLFGVTPIAIQTESMKPVLNKGDLIFTKKVGDVKTLKKGDIISFWITVDGKRVINTHEIIEITNNNLFKTKGKNNQTADTEAVFPSNIISKFTGTKWPVLGAVLSFLQTATGFLICIVLPLVLFFLYQLYKFIKTIAGIKKEAALELSKEQKKAVIDEYLASKEKEEKIEEETENR